MSEQIAITDTTAYNDYVNSVIFKMYKDNLDDFNSVKHFSDKVSEHFTGTDEIPIEDGRIPNEYFPIAKLGGNIHNIDRTFERIQEYEENKEYIKIYGGRYGHYSFDIYDLYNITGLLKDLSEINSNFNNYQLDGILGTHEQYLFQKSIEKLFKVVGGTLSELREHFLKEEISIDYFFYLDLYNYKAFALYNHEKPTPGTFKLLAVNTPEKNRQVLTHLKRQLLYGPQFSDESLDPYGQNEYRDYLLNNNLLFKSEEDPGWDRYIGWNKQELAKALVDAGIFDFNVTPVDNKYQIEFPKLKAIGIADPPLTNVNTPEKLIKRIPRYALETIYLNTMDTTPDWDSLCQFAPTEELRELGYREFGVTLPQDRTEVCKTLSQITRNKELSSVLPELQTEFIYRPGVQFKKQMKGGYTYEKGYIKPDVIDIEKYLTEINDICADPLKGTQDAYELATNIGIERYVNQNQSKSEICRIIQKYLNVIREERIL